MQTVVYEPSGPLISQTVPNTINSTSSPEDMLEESHVNHPDSSSAHDASISDSLHNVQTQESDHDHESSGPQAGTSSDSDGYNQLQQLRLSSPAGLDQSGKRRASEDLVSSRPSKRTGICKDNHHETQGTLNMPKNKQASSASKSNIQDDHKPNLVHEAQSSTSGHKVSDVGSHALEETVAHLKKTVADLECSADSIFEHLVELDSKQHLQHKTITNHLEEMTIAIRALHSRVGALETR